jgi:hypothetical protein
MQKDEYSLVPFSLLLINIRLVSFLLFDLFTLRMNND